MTSSVTESTLFKRPSLHHCYKPDQVNNPTTLCIMWKILQPHLVTAYGCVSATRLSYFIDAKYRTGEGKTPVWLHSVQTQGHVNNSYAVWAPVPSANSIFAGWNNLVLLLLKRHKPAHESLHSNHKTRICQAANKATRKPQESQNCHSWKIQTSNKDTIVEATERQESRPTAGQRNKNLKVVS